MGRVQEVPLPGDDMKARPTEGNLTTTSLHGLYALYIAVYQTMYPKSKSIEVIIERAKAQAGVPLKSDYIAGFLVAFANTNFFETKVKVTPYLNVVVREPEEALKRLDTEFDRRMTRTTPTNVENFRKARQMIIEEFTVDEEDATGPEDDTNAEEDE